MYSSARMTLAALVAAASMAGTAQAQKAGFFSGTADDGTNISLTVTGTGPYTITGMNVNMNAPCNTGANANEGWGFFLGQVINPAGMNWSSRNDYYDSYGTLKFASNTRITGLVTSRTAVFDPTFDPPRAARFCFAHQQHFQLLWQHATQPMPLGTAVVTSNPQ